MINYAPLCEKQSEYIRASMNSWLNVAEGGKRAGKNITNLIAWAACLESHPDHLHLAAGVTMSSAKMNIIDSDGFGLMWLFQGRCKLGNYMGRAALIIQTRTGEKVVIIGGGNDSRSASLIKGHSYGTAYITEVNECHQTFFQEALDRTLASSKRQLFFDLNPKPPAHWFYSEFLDYQDKLKELGRNNGYNYQHFTIADNMSMHWDVIQSELSKYDPSSVWYQRDILGLRTSASGRIYTAYEYEKCAVSQENIAKMNFIELAVGIDVGGTDATVATLTGLTKDLKIVHIAGYYNKQGIDNKMDEATYAHEICEWLVPWYAKYPKLGTVYVDSANKLFQSAMRSALIRRKLGKFDVRSFNKKDGILQRIELTCMLLAQGRYLICEDMKKWHEAMQMATWIREEYEEGEWKRTDDGSYPVDCLDSAEYSYYGMRRYLNI